MPDNRLVPMGMLCIFRRILLAGVLTMMGAGTVLAQDAKKDKPSSLPGGATSLSESFGDWSVNCTTGTSGSACTVSQVQAQQSSGRRLLAIRFIPTAAKPDADGQLVLPLGLELAKGVSAQVDEGALSTVYPFRTCLPTGCIVPLRFEQKTFSGLLGGKSLKITAVSTDNHEIPFTVSLNGFKAAIDRATVLSKAK